MSSASTFEYLLGPISPQDLRSINFPHPSGLMLHIEKQLESRLAHLGEKTRHPLIHLTAGKMNGPFTVADLEKYSLPADELCTYLGNELIRNVLVEKYVNGIKNTLIFGASVRSWGVGTNPRYVHFGIAIGDKDLLETLTDDMFK